MFSENSQMSSMESHRTVVERWCFGFLGSDLGCFNLRILELHPPKKGLKFRSFFLLTKTQICVLSQQKKYYLQEKLTWQWKITSFDARYIFKRSILHCHVSFWGSSTLVPGQIIGNSTFFCWMEPPPCFVEDGNLFPDTHDESLHVFFGSNHSMELGKTVEPISFRLFWRVKLGK